MCFVKSPDLPYINPSAHNRWMYVARVDRDCAPQRFFLVIDGCWYKPAASTQSYDGVVSGKLNSFNGSHHHR